MSIPLIELRSICLAFEELMLFDNYSLQIFKGDSLVLVGPSGSGKSTLLKMMAGLVEPDAGEVVYQGKNLSTLSRKERARQLAEMGMLFQQNALFDSMTVYENLDFVLAELQGNWDKSRRNERIQPLLKAVGLDHVPTLYPTEISGGMQKRLGIARAVVVEPQVIFYDDPTAGLDPITSRNIIQMILNLQKKSGGTIVTITHDMARAYQLAGRCMVCFPGAFLETGSAEQTQHFADPRVQQFIRGSLEGPLQAL